MQPIHKNIFLELPLPPSVNNYWGFSGHKRFLTLEAREFKTAVAYKVMQQPIRFGDAKLEMTVTINFRDKRIADISNRLKALEDALVQAGLMHDDSQLKVIHLYEGPIVKGGKCSVKINVLPF
jgi:Holliday junction resolvase RusA-like endonuclease